MRKSPRDIKAILDKVNPDHSSTTASASSSSTSSQPSQSQSQFSKAYHMFSQGGTPVQVAIELNLRENDVSELYIEYWTLSGIYELNQIYNEIKDDIWSV